VKSLSSGKVLGLISDKVIGLISGKVSTLISETCIFVDCAVFDSQRGS